MHSERLPPCGRVSGVSVLLRATVKRLAAPYDTTFVTSASNGRNPPLWLATWTPLTHLIRLKLELVGKCFKKSTTYNDGYVMGTPEAKFHVIRRRLPIFRHEQRPVVPDPSGVISQSSVLVDVVET